MITQAITGIILVIVVLTAICVRKQFDKLKAQVKKSERLCDSYRECLQESRQALRQQRREAWANLNALLNATDDEEIRRNFWFDCEDYIIRHYKPATGRFSWRDFYSFTQDTFDDPYMMDEETPLHATAYVKGKCYVTMSGGWRIEAECLEYLADGELKTKRGEII